MDKKTKFLIIGGVLIALGVGLSIVLGKGKRLEDVGEIPNPDANGNIPPSDGGEVESVASQLEGGQNEIQAGDYVRPYNQYVNLRDSMEINNGFWWNNLYSPGDIEGGRIYSPDIVGQVLSINKVDDKTWYEINVSAAVYGENSSMNTINQYNAQDTSVQGYTAYVRATTCDEINSEEQCIGNSIPTLKKV